MTQHNDQDRVWKLIEDIGFAMLVTHDGQGDELRARPMHAHGDPRRGRDLFPHRRAITRMTRSRSTTMSASPSPTTAGTATSRSPAPRTSLTTARRSTSSGSRATRRSGTSKNDPNIRVLRVQPSMAEFWDNPGKIVTTVKMAAAALTGAKLEFGENRKVTL